MKPDLEQRPHIRAQQFYEHNVTDKPMNDVTL